jgi:phenylpyruvate tautomerase PptA (4-oxalocrotonate tautomerase family)
MAQVKVYALRTALEGHQSPISDALHAAVMVALEYPLEKRFHRFFPLEREDFIFTGRSEKYLILKILMFEGRSVEAKKHLIREIYQNLEPLGFAPNDVEITLLESPRYHWGIRGVLGDELNLTYKVEV